MLPVLTLSGSMQSLLVGGKTMNDSILIERGVDGLWEVVLPRNGSLETYRFLSRGAAIWAAQRSLDTLPAKEVKRQ